MEIKKLKHCLSFLLSLFFTFSPCLPAFAQDFSRSSSSSVSAASAVDRTAKLDGINLGWSVPDDGIGPGCHGQHLG